MSSFSPVPIPIEENCARSSFSESSTGTYLSTKSSVSKNVVDVRCSSGVWGTTKSIAAGAARRHRAEELRQRFHSVAGLDRLHVVDVVGAQQLRAVQHQHEVGLCVQHLIDTGGLLALPVRTGEEVLPGLFPVARLPR